MTVQPAKEVLVVGRDRELAASVKALLEIALPNVRATVVRSGLPFRRRLDAGLLPPLVAVDEEDITLEDAVEAARRAPELVQILSARSATPRAELRMIPRSSPEQIIRFMERALGQAEAQDK